MKHTLMFTLATAAGIAYAGTVAVDGDRNVGVTVESGQVTQTDTIRFGDGGTFIKTGAGELVLPGEKIDKSRDYAIRVSGGTLTLQAGTNDGEPVDAPSVISEKAAFWVDAADELGSLVTEGAVVKRWCDCRERNFTSPSLWNARPKSAGVGSKQLEQTLVVKDGRRAVYFGGYDTANDNYMKFSRGETEEKLTNVKHLFAVHGVYECWAPPIGATGNPCDWFVNSAILPYPSNVICHFIQYANTMSGVFTGRTFLDGARVDPFVIPPNAGFQLLETEFTDVPSVVDAFYNMKGVAGRQGGDYLSEAIVFTNALTATERLEVEDYLMRKWNLGNARKQLGVGHISTAPGTTVSVDVSTDDDKALAGVKLTGEGKLDKEGEGTLIVGKRQLLDFRGELDLNAGHIALRAGSLPALKIAAGEKLESVVSYPGEYQKPNCTNPVWYAQCGYDVYKCAASKSDRFEKVGDGTLTVQTIPETVKCVDVKAGTLVLAAPATSSVLVADAPLKAFVPNADFEEPCTANQGYNRCLFAQGTTLNGWTRSSIYKYVGYLVEDYSAGDVGPSPQHSRSTMSYAPIAQGVQALIICNNGEAYTDSAIFPKSGYYTLSLLESSRYNKEQTGSYRVKLGATWETADVLAERLVNAQGFRRVKIDLGYVEAGKYCLGFSVFAGNGKSYVDGALLFDDLSVDFTGEVVDESLVRIPNGDFEICTNRVLVTDSDAINPVLAYTRSSGNEAVGWTFRNDSPENPAVALVSTVTPVSKSGSNLTSDNYRPSDIVDGLFGSVHLSMFGLAGSASTSFALKKGRYRLRGKALHRGGKFDEVLDNAGSVKSVVAAKVAIGGQEKILGSVTVKNSVMKTFDWPDEFEVSEDEVIVTLTLNQTEAKGMCLVDDLVLVEENGFVGYDEELVSNGSFEESMTGWTSIRSTFGDRSVDHRNPWKTAVSDDIPYQFGSVPYDGEAYLLMNNDSGIYQELHLVPGLYRLTFAAHTRNTVGYDQQPIRAWLGDESGVKVVEIGRTPLITTLFDQEFAWEFRVAETGKYRLYIQGTDDFKGAANRHTSIIDGVSLKRVRASESKPSVTVSTELRLTKGTRLRLDYDGTNKVDRVVYDGRIYKGILTSETHSEFIDGRGVLETSSRKGLFVVVR